MCPSCFYLFHLSVCLSVCCLSISVSIPVLSICLFVYPSVFLSIYLTGCLFVYLSNCLPFFLLAFCLPVFVDTSVFASCVIWCLHVSTLVSHGRSFLFHNFFILKQLGNTCGSAFFSLTFQGLISWWPTMRLRGFLTPPEGGPGAPANSCAAPSTAARLRSTSLGTSTSNGVTGRKKAMASKVGVGKKRTKGSKGVWVARSFHFLCLKMWRSRNHGSFVDANLAGFQFVRPASFVIGLDAPSTRSVCSIFGMLKPIIEFQQAINGASGGVEYRPNPSSNQIFRPNGPPPADYPVQVESNNAMANQPAVDHSWTGVWAPQHIVGRPRLITAKRNGDAWKFTSEVLWTGQFLGNCPQS